MKRAACVLVAALFGLTACSSDNTNTITVSAAASLTDSFTALGAAFEQDNSGIVVRFNFAGSSTLAEQLVAGAPVDVFAAASSEAMDRAVQAGTVEQPELFATNTLAIAVPPNNPAQISRLDDLAHPDITIVVCDVPVPCGAATQRLFDANALSVAPASLERDVRAVLTKVIQDEADAGIVYRTDITAAGDGVHGIDISSESNVINSYPIAVSATAGDSSRDLATEFVDFVLSDDGQSILRSWGFGTP